MGRSWSDEDQPYVVIEKSTSSVGSLMLGVAIGAGLALLFAPQAGEQTRAALGREAQRARRRAADIATDATDAVSETIQQARGAVEERIGSARQSIDVKRQQVSRAVEAGRQAARDARTDLERRIAETKAAYDAGAQVARDGEAGDEGGANSGA